MTTIRLVNVRGIGHILMHDRSGWAFTACGMASPSLMEANHRPARICTKCRAMLPEISPVREPTTETHDAEAK